MVVYKNAIFYMYNGCICKYSIKSLERFILSGTEKASALKLLHTVDMLVLPKIVIRELSVYLWDARLRKLPFKFLFSYMLVG